jgi:hypothetical protein
MKRLNKAIINEKGLFFGFVRENAPKPELPSHMKEVEITEQNYVQIAEIAKQMGAPVLIGGTFVNKKEELKDYLVAPTPKNLNK